MYTQIHRHTYIYTYMRTYTYKNTYIHTYIHTHVCTHYIRTSSPSTRTTLFPVVAPCSNCTVCMPSGRCIFHSPTTSL